MFSTRTGVLRKSEIKNNLRVRWMARKHPGLFADIVIFGPNYGYKAQFPKQFTRTQRGIK